jgi:hypothetical protein
MLRHLLALEATLGERDSSDRAIFVSDYSSIYS